MAAFAAGEVPRYLFRVHTPSSAGATTPTHVHSQAAPWHSSSTSNLFDWHPEDAEFLLCRHLNWRTSDLVHSNLASWTSSLLFTLQYGLYTHKRGHGRGPFSQSYILIIDTHEVPPGTYVKDIEILATLASSLPESESGFESVAQRLLRLRTKPTKSGERSYFSECLGQGALEVEVRVDNHARPDRARLV